MKVGIDSSLDTRTLVASGLTLLADAAKWLGQKPDFVIRPTGIGGNAGATPASIVEIAALASAGIRVGLYFNDSTLNGGAAPSYTLGINEGAEASRQLAALGAPDTCPVLLDIEQNATLSPAYLQGFIKGARRPVYVYGIPRLIGPSIEQSGVQLGMWASAWLQNPDGSPKVLDYANAAQLTIPTYGSLAPSCWQFCGNAFDGICDEDVSTDAFCAGLWDGHAAVSTPPVSVATGSGNPAKAAIVSAIAELQKALSLL